MLKILVFKSKESNVCQHSHKYTFMKIYMIKKWILKNAETVTFECVHAIARA